jgi:hypothetical protein
MIGPSYKGDQDKQKSTNKPKFVTEERNEKPELHEDALKRLAAECAL